MQHGAFLSVASAKKTKSRSSVHGYGTLVRDEAAAFKRNAPEG